MTHNFMDAVRKRRSIYAIGKDKVISGKKVQELVEQALLHVPSAFNSQNGRIVLLLEKESAKFWNMVRETLRGIVPADAFAKTEEKLASFDAGWGTILFFEERKTVENLMEQFPLYKDNFPVWSLQSNGMLQFAIWTALEAEGLGASLQHYNPLVDDAVAKEWNIPKTWKLLAQMPFGSVVAPAGQKEFMPLEERLKVF